MKGALRIRVVLPSRRSRDELVSAWPMLAELRRGEGGCRDRSSVALQASQKLKQTLASWLSV